MALITTDRVKENTRVIGLNTAILTGSPSGFKTFSTVMDIGDTCYYSIVDTRSGYWETGIGTLISANSLERTTVKTSSNNDNKVSFTDGNKIVSLALTSDQFVNLVSSTLTQSDITSLVDDQYYPIFSNSTVGSNISLNFPGDSVYLIGETTNSNVSGHLLKFYRGLIYDLGNSPTTYVSGSYVNVEDIDVWTYFKTVNDPDNAIFSSGLYNYLDSAGGVTDQSIELDYLNGVTLRYNGLLATLNSGFEFSNEFYPTSKSVKVVSGGPNPDFSSYGNSSVGSVSLVNYLDMQEAEIKNLREHTILANGPTVNMGFLLDPAGDTPSNVLYLANGNVDFIFSIGSGATPRINEWPLGSRIRIILIQDGTVRLNSTSTPLLKTLKGTGWDITCVLNAAGNRELFIRDVDESILKPTTASANQVLTYNGTAWQSANSVTAFNTRTGDVTLTANDITTLVDANYIQVWRDTQANASILAQFPKYSAITSSSGPIQGYSRGLLTSNTSGTVTKTIFDGSLYASSVSTVLQYKAIGFNANDTGAANSVKSGRLLLGQYGEAYLESSTKVNANTLTTATFDVLATQRPSGTTQIYDPHAINGGIHARYAIGTTGAYDPQSNADRVSGGKIAEFDLYNITQLIASFSNGTSIGRPAQVYLTATNDLTAADPDLAFDHAYDYKTILKLGESAELVFQNANRTLLRTPNMTEYSILTQGYADVRYNLALNNVTHANSTDLTAGGAIRGDTHNFTSGAYTIQQYNGFLSDSNTTEPTSVRIGRTCITTSTGLPFLDNYYRAAGVYSGIYSVKPQSNATASFYMYNSSAVIAVTEVVPGDIAPSARSKSINGYATKSNGFTGAYTDLEATDDNNGTLRLTIVANSTHAQSQLGLFPGMSGNLTMLYAADSILTQGYADTRYQQTPNVTFTGNFTSQDGRVVTVANGIITSVV